jgi:predicted small lipoprotein YifL
VKQQRNLRLISGPVFALVVGGLLSACGAKGALVLPPPEQKVEQVVKQEKTLKNESKAEAK